MRRLLFACGAVLLLCRPAVAQTGPEPTMILTLFGGASTGHSLWHIPQQPLCVLQQSGGAYNCTSQYDTLDLSRDISASVVFGASGTYFRSPHVGIEAEILFLGFPFDDSCRGIFFNPDLTHMNEQICLNVGAASISSSAISFSAGLVFRASPRHAISPFARVGFGIVTHSGGTLELSGAFLDDSGIVRSRSIIEDPHPKATTLSVKASAGFTTRISPGYQFRLEAHDAIVPLRRVIGMADDLAQAPSASRSYHHLVITMGLDVVLEKKRGRRY